MSIESEGTTSNVELESALAGAGYLPFDETVNLEGGPPEKECETRLEAIAAEIESVLGTAILRVAALVAEAHELYRYKHGDGGFEGWVERRLKMSRQTAYNLLNVHKQFGGRCVQILDTLPRSILYLIAPDSVPAAARTEVIERAEAGEKLSHAQVKEIVAGHKTKPPTPNKNRKPREQAQASHDWVAALAAKTTTPTAVGIVAAKEDAKPAESTAPPDSVILDADADFESIDRGIDVLYSRWTVLVYQAIQAAVTVRRIKAIHDKAAAWEMHTRQTRNPDAERLYREIRLHAERKGGQLLIYTMKKGLRFTGRPPKGLKIGMVPSDQDTLKKYGITRKQSHQWQRTARMPERKFKVLLAGKPARCRLPSRRHRGKQLRPAA
jgi:hypothetical protein